MSLWDLFTPKQCYSVSHLFIAGVISVCVCVCVFRIVACECLFPSLHAI